MEGPERLSDSYSGKQWSGDLSPCNMGTQAFLLTSVSCCFSRWLKKRIQSINEMKIKLQKVIVYLGVYLSKNLKMYYNSHLLFCVIHAVDQVPIL